MPIKKLLVHAVLASTVGLLGGLAHAAKNRDKLRVPSLKDSLVLQGRAQKEALKRGEPVSLLVWNVKRLDKHKVQGRVEAYAKRCDAVLLQEARVGRDAKLVAMWDRILDPPTGGGGGRFLAFGITYQKGTRVLGVATFGGFMPMRQKLIRAEAREFIKGSSKVALFSWVRLSDGGVEAAADDGSGALLLVNVHALNFVRLGNYKKQMAQIAAQLQMHNGPVVLAGDFNAYDWRRNKVVRVMARGLGLEEVDFSRGGIWPWKLDRVFTRGVEVLSAERLEHVEGSDHFPLHINIRVLEK